MDMAAVGALPKTDARAVTDWVRPTVAARTSGFKPIFSVFLSTCDVVSVISSENDGDL